MLCTLDGEDIKRMSEDNFFLNELHEPIPITEEILLKCGFEKEEVYGCPHVVFYFRGKLMDLTLDFKLSTSHSRDYGSQSVNGSQVFKYVHQLQNIYFALTGQELEIKF